MTIPEPAEEMVVVRRRRGRVVFVRRRSAPGAHVRVSPTMHLTDVLDEVAYLPVGAGRHLCVEPGLCGGLGKERPFSLKRVKMRRGIHPDTVSRATHDCHDAG